MPTALSTAPLLSLVQDGWHEVQHDFLVSVMPLASALASSITPLLSLGQDYRNEVWHMTPLASCNANGIISSTTTFLRSRQLKWGIAWHFGQVMPLVSVLVSYDANGIIRGKYILYIKMIIKEKQHNFLGHVMPIVLVSASCDATCTSVSSLWC